MKELYQPKKPQFFQVIVAGTLQLGKLEVPSKFVRKYGNFFSHSVDLTVPSGDSWTVGVERFNKSIILGDGLKKFAQHFSLDDGFFVVFKYEAHSVFTVTIYDESFTEVKYPLRAEEMSHEEEEAAAAAASFGSSSKTSTETSDADYQFSDDSEEQEQEDDDEDFSVKDSYKAAAVSGSRRRMPVRTDLEHPYFALRIKPSYLKRKSRVTVPLWFVEEHNLMEKLNVKLRLRGVRKTWNLKFYYRHENEKRGEFSNACWHKFARNVGLRVGDVCEFEMTSRQGDDLFFTMSIVSRGPAAPT